jgi:hypothetical protein
VISVSRKKITNAGFTWFRIIDRTDPKSVEILPLVSLVPNLTAREFAFLDIDAGGIYAH